MSPRLFDGIVRGAKRPFERPEDDADYSCYAAASGTEVIAEGSKQLRLVNPARFTSSDSNGCHVYPGAEILDRPEEPVFEPYKRPPSE